ncbi:MAG: hypothetical protein GPJ51_11030 [Candidatus Heimdallarchaeota archaeon]|nr:hypothetical protein [Candidatus Heimdallarchaeota archaeon]
MTGQIPDSFLYEGEVYSLIGIEEEEPFSPLDYDIMPEMASTACWRGFVLYYKLDDNYLTLQDMQLNTQEAKKINGVKPMKTKDMFKFHYQDLNLKLDYTGKLLIARDFIDEMYVHMGFQRPIAFRKVVELDFNNGELLSVNDLSEQMENRRNKSPADGARPKTMKDKDVKNWIKDTFSRKQNKEEK